jgi:hypothetical protein
MITNLRVLKYIPILLRVIGSNECGLRRVAEDTGNIFLE